MEAMYDEHNHPFFVHPLAHARRDYGLHAGEQQSHHPTRAAMSRTHQRCTSPERHLPTSAIEGMMAEMRVSLAAKQLAEQVRESTRFWRGFRNEYAKEVNSIKFYVDADVLQQIWRQKVKHNKYKGGEKQDDQQFGIQSMKLKSCLSQVDEVTKLLAKAQSSDNSSGHDSRQHHLEKVRATGSLVIGLTKKSMSNEIVCKDLLGELSELEKLTDPSKSTARILHRFDGRKSQKPTRSEKKEVEDSTRSQNEEGNNHAEPNSFDAWPENNELNTA
ncbi:hypothetical protein F5Y19DRAFT_102129 [Xylariaceae sp. FL1651]|nr:hypothetical protein F5Y19DRAFT_102129 [Xylariaceae sp. FL1651]